VGVGAVVAVFVVCAHLLGGSVPELPSDHHHWSSEAYDENDESDISYYYVPHPVASPLSTPFSTTSSTTGKSSTK
jgi:hypothetical protein